MRKLIFLRKGMLFDYPKFLNTDVYKEHHYVYIDYDIQGEGYKRVLQKIENNAIDYEQEYIMTTCPELLREHMWWNEQEKKWEIYFVEEKGLVPIQEYTDKWLREVHNIEKLYLNGGLDLPDEE